MTAIRKYGQSIAYLIFVGGVVFALYLVNEQALGTIEKEADRTAQLLYQNTVEACERGNKLRYVTYAAIKEANKNRPDTDYARQLQIFRDIPYIRPDGTIDCRKAIPRP